MTASAKHTLRTTKSLFLLIIIIPFAALVGLLLASGRGQVSATLNSSVSQVVDVMSISLRQQYSERRVAVGQVEANQLSSLSFDRAGEVIQTWVDEGQHVEVGQLMAQLDPKRLLVNIQEINATLARVEADLRLAKMSEKRVAELVTKKLESSQRLDEVREATAAANALVTEIKARKATIELELVKSHLYAPFSGQIISRPVDKGTVINAGQTVFVLQQENNLQVRIALPAEEAQQFIVAQNTQLLWKNMPVKAQVLSVAQQRNLSTRTVDVLFTLEPSSQLLAGDLVMLERQIKIELAGCWVPRTALMSGVRGLWSVFTIGINEQQQTFLVSKLVEVNYVDENKAYISGALAPDTQLVVDGVHKLVPGQQVTVQVIANADMSEFNESVL
jgi:RND family efflux transporter MFP subunit